MLLREQLKKPFKAAVFTSDTEARSLQGRQVGKI